jgi:hypothetical protein
VVEYQVQQTIAGAAIELRAAGHVETDALAGAIERDLAAAGVVDPRVSVRTVDALGRQTTGKLKRFVPLPPA